MHRAKIAIVAYNLDRGGLTNATLTLLKILSMQKKLAVNLLLLEQVQKTFDETICVDFRASRDPKKRGRLKKIKTYLAFKSYLKNNKFDFIIDSRYRINPISEIFFSKVFYYKKQVIYTIHSSNLSHYLSEYKFLTRFLYKNAYKLVCCSIGVKNEVVKTYKLTNVSCIYNAINKSEKKIVDKTPFGFNYIVAVGRFEPEKQYDKLIRAYSKSILPVKDIKLVLVGDGSQQPVYNKLVRNLNLQEKVVFTGYVPNPYLYYKFAMFSVLCSKFEGFGLVIVESLAVSTPVVSFDVASGPNEIIIHNNNGILVEDQNFDALTDAMDTLIEDEKKLVTYSTNAKKSIERFYGENIVKDWLKLMRITNGIN